MTLIAAEPQSVSAPEHDLTWVEVEPGFWAGNHAGVFLGTVEEHGDRFRAFDALHRHLGDFPTLPHAQHRASAAAGD